MLHNRGGIIVVFSVVLLGWFLYRTNLYGLNDVFSRERRFVDNRQLTEAVAIELTRRTLELNGHDTSTMKPLEYRSYYPEGSSERLFSRNSLNPNSGYVLWITVWMADAPVRRQYRVNIDKDGSLVRCRVFRGK